MKFIASFLVVCLSCFSQEIKVEDLEGNWQLYKVMENNETPYNETYFNVTYFQSVSLYGYSKALKFEIDNNIIYTLSSDESKREYLAHISLNDSKDILELNSHEDQVFLKRIEGIFTFGNYSNETISKSDFWDAFLNRKSIWEEEKNKSD